MTSPAPLDSSSGRSAIGYQAASRFLPLAQISFSWQFTDQLALVGYQQGEWRRSRTDPHDAYASAADLLAGGSEQVIGFLSPRSGRRYYVREDSPVPNGFDQFGL